MMVGVARPRSQERRDAILSAATRVIASEGLGASTAAIAKEAGVSNGSLFVYFDSKAMLVNELYARLKGEMGAAALAGLPEGGEPRAQVLHMWTGWLGWATRNPDGRRALAQLEVADEITAETRQMASAAFDGIADLLERSRANGPMYDASLRFVLVLISAVADATADAMIRDPAEADTHSRVAFDAVWRVLAGSSPSLSPDQTKTEKESI